LSGADAFLERDEDGVFWAQQPGHVAVVALGVNEVAADFIHVSLVQIEDLLISGPSGRTLDALEMELGSQRLLTVQPVDAAGQVLAGSLDCAFASSDERVVSSEPGPSVAQEMLFAEAAGEVNVEIACGAVQREVSVLVSGGV
jgi:hypothetical protein